MNKLFISLSVFAGLLLSTAVQAEGSVARAVITTAVAEREPVNDLERVMEGNEKVLFFTELKGMQGQSVSHRWFYGEQMMAEVAFNVGGPRWRVWSSKKLLPEWGGEWRVEVVVSDGSIVGEKTFTFAGDGSEATPTSAPLKSEASNE